MAAMASIDHHQRLVGAAGDRRDRETIGLGCFQRDGDALGVVAAMQCDGRIERAAGAGGGLERARAGVGELND